MSCTHTHRGPSSFAREGCKFHFNIQTALFAVRCVFGLSGPVSTRDIKYSLYCREKLKDPYTAQAIFVRSVSIYADPFA